MLSRHQCCPLAPLQPGRLYLFPADCSNSQRPICQAPVLLLSTTAARSSLVFSRQQFKFTKTHFPASQIVFNFFPPTFEIHRGSTWNPALLWVRGIWIFCSSERKIRIYSLFLRGLCWPPLKLQTSLICSLVSWQFKTRAFTTFYSSQMPLIFFAQDRLHSFPAKISSRPASSSNSFPACGWGGGGVSSNILHPFRLLVHLRLLHVGEIVL